MKPSILWAPLIGAAMIGIACASPILQTQQSDLPPTMSPNQTFKVHKTDAEWRKQLSPEAYDVLRQAGTESPESSPLDHNHAAGIYYCAGCGQPLFSSDAKFDSGTGWPSFFKPISKDAVLQRKDMSLGMEREEILCSRCGGHLGHVFDDGPAPTGLRYCMNGVALNFKKGPTQLPKSETQPAKSDKN